MKENMLRTEPHKILPSKTLCHYRGLPFGSPNSGHTAPLRSGQIQSDGWTSNVRKPLCAIRKPAFGNGDHKFTRLLPSFNGNETSSGNSSGNRREFHL